ncbi:Receptor-type tyrosine-protein phosphatase F [Anas platyrhynchos]|uniref:Receptor-type tyrosine-protein phosphatase F n=1 Tax=Anas platyrhynchos TaxID=8839 RepID=R0LQX2_ANAPL|nr:Receptor-type tyrosine-protein phosphatase F [Anas platyrhynchos]
MTKKAAFCEVRGSICFREALVTLELHVGFGCWLLEAGKGGKPTFMKAPEDQIGISGGVASFVCQATGEPKPRITWMKKGKKVSSQRFEVIEFDDGSGSVLRIQPLRVHRDEAIYECTATNSVGEINTSAKLTVLEDTERQETSGVCHLVLYCHKVSSSDRRPRSIPRRTRGSLCSSKQSGLHSERERLLGQVPILKQQINFQIIEKATVAFGTGRVLPSPAPVTRKPPGDPVIVRPRMEINLESGSPLNLGQAWQHQVAPSSRGCWRGRYLLLLTQGWEQRMPDLQEIVPGLETKAEESATARQRVIELKAPAIPSRALDTAIWYVSAIGAGTDTERKTRRCLSDDLWAVSSAAGTACQCARCGTSRQLLDLLKSRWQQHVHAPRSASWVRRGYLWGLVEKQQLDNSAVGAAGPTRAVSQHPRGVLLLVVSPLPMKVPVPSGSPWCQREGSSSPSSPARPAGCVTVAGFRWFGWQAFNKLQLSWSYLCGFPLIFSQHCCSSGFRHYRELFATHPSELGIVLPAG